MTGWISLGAYLLITEILLKVGGNPAISTEKICKNLFKLNIVLTTILLLVIAFKLENQDYLFLCIIPIFQAALFRKPVLIAGIIGASSLFVFIASSTLASLMSFITVIGVLTFLGITLSNMLSYTSSKADFLYSIATTDGLTGLLNRREFDKRILEEFSRAKRHKSTLSLALFDIDFFKKINDTYGHNTGDVILRELSKLISANTRNCDVLARYGGEEFALILPETPQARAYELLERLRAMVEKETFNKSIRPLNATISVGVAQIDPNDSTPVNFVERADQALYKAKEGGRNRVEKAPINFPYFIKIKKEAV